MAPIPEAMTMFRSVPRSEFGDVPPEDLRGFVVQDAGFFPTSAAPSTPVPGEVRMQIDVPAGTHAAGSPDTSELIIDAGTEMSVDGITTNPDGSTLMTLTALPPEGSGDQGGSPGATEPAPESTPAPTPAPAAGPDIDEQFSSALSGNEALGSLAAGMPPPRGLTEDQEDAYTEYRDLSFIPINRSLRGGDPAAQIDGASAPRTQVNVWVSNMDEAMNGSRTTQNMVTYRGVQRGTFMFGDRLNGNLEGMEWREDAFVSSSTDANIANDFATEAKDSSQAVVMRVLVPAGTGAVQLSGDEYESEALLERGLTMRVVRDNGGTPRQIDVEVVPADAD